MRLPKLIIALVCTVSLMACENASKAPAETAIKAANDAYTPVSADARKYVPDQAKGVEDAIAAAQALAAKEDWAGALTQAQGIPARIATLGAAIAAQKTQMSGAWAAMSASLPAMVAAVKARIDAMKTPPAGMTKDSMAQAKSDADAASSEWTQAMTAATSGDMATAMSKANDVQSKVMALMSMLKMSAPAGK